MVVRIGDDEDYVMENCGSMMGRNVMASYEAQLGGTVECSGAPSHGSHRARVSMGLMTPRQRLLSFLSIPTLVFFFQPNWGGARLQKQTSSLLVTEDGAPYLREIFEVVDLKFQF